MRVPRCWTVVLAVVLVAASVMPAGAVTESGGFGGGLVAVGAGGFSDVDDGSVHAPAVEVLAASGVFDGTECGQGLFCPGDPILRWEMAVWLVRVLDRTEPDTVGSSRFADVYTDVWWASYVERFAELEVTQGCATEPLRYCPDEVATRAQMASFLVRAFGFPAGASAGFSDVGVGETHTANIDALAASRVTAGCATGPLRFCPQKAGHPYAGGHVVGPASRRHHRTGRNRPQAGTERNIRLLVWFPSCPELGLRRRRRTWPQRIRLCYTKGTRLCKRFVHSRYCACSASVRPGNRDWSYVVSRRPRGRLGPMV